MGRVGLDVSARPNVTLEAADNVLRISLVRQAGIISKPDTPSPRWSGSLSAIMIRECKDERRIAGGNARRKPAWIRVTQFEMDFGALIDMAFLYGSSTKGGQGRIEFNVAQTVSKP